MKSAGPGGTLSSSTEPHRPGIREGHRASKAIGLAPPTGGAKDISDALFRRLKKLRHQRGMPVHENSPLTKREHQIIQVLTEGITNRDRRLRLTEGTVKVHLHRIYLKQGIGNRTALAACWRPQSR